MHEHEVFEALKYRIEVNGYGTRRYYNNADQLHRTNGPAVVYSNGVLCWYFNGEELTEAEFNQRVNNV